MSLSLLEADSLMEKRPDSALFILRKMGFPEKLLAEEYATWCLLLTQAMDKNYESHDSDSIINIAVNYFNDQKDLSKKAKALYYHGRVNQDLGQPEKALFDYLSALDVAQKTNEYKLCGLICDNLGQIYRKQFMYDHSIPRFQQACQYYVQAGDTLGQIYALRNIGRTYTEIEPYSFDSAYVSYKQACMLAEQMNHTLVQSSILNDLGNEYKRQGNYVLAKDMIMQAIRLSPQKSALLLPKYSNLGDVYMKIGVYDSARYYFNASLQSPDLFTQGNAYSRLAELEGLLGNYKQACLYKDQYFLCVDSLNSQLHGAELNAVERKYNEESAISEIREKALMQKNFYLSVVCAFIILFFSVFFWYKKRQRKKDLEILQKEQEIRRFKELASQHMKQIDSSVATINSLKEQNAALSLSEQEFESNKCTIQENQQIIADLESRITEAENALTSAGALKEKVDQLQVLLMNQSLVYKGIEPYVGKTHRNKEDLNLCFKTSDWVEFLIIFNDVHDDLLNNLKKEYKLDHDDLVLVSLIKLSIIAGNIQLILNLNSPSLVTRKKTRLANRLNISLPEVEKFIMNRKS